MSLAEDLEAVALLATATAGTLLEEKRDREVAAALLSAAASVLSALRAPELAAAHAELAAIREALRARDGTLTVDAARSCYQANKELRQKIADAKKDGAT